MPNGLLPLPFESFVLLAKIVRNVILHQKRRCEMKSPTFRPLIVHPTRCPTDCARYHGHASCEQPSEVRVERIDGSSFRSAASFIEKSINIFNPNTPKYDSYLRKTYFIKSNILRELSSSLINILLPGTLPILLNQSHPSSLSRRDLTLKSIRHRKQALA